ncbi:MAG: cytidylate kinase family protein [Candidatus Aenigmarchaeota archaeon]|nr:cytidylate kinase family protein [Candidatus Aenigmarchaeota archaeon]
MAVIVVSGMPGAGSSTVASLLAKRLNLRHFSAGDFFKKKAVESGVKEGETRRATEFLLTERGSRKDFHVDIDDLQRELAKAGNIVIDGKLSIRLLSGLYDVSVWLKAPDDVRARRISGRDGIPEKEALKAVKERDRIERQSFLRIYGFDTFSQENEAGIVVDTSDMTPEEIVNLIVKKMKESNKKGW